MARATGILAQLLGREPVTEPVLLLAAHPDDETVGAGASLHLFRNLLLLHATDGAPRNLVDARRAGFDSAEKYASCRRVELSDALRVGNAQARCIGFDIADQQASFCMAELAQQIACHIEQHGARAVLTHPYEGGHPDHDACAFAARMAIILAASHLPPPRLLEMTSYHAGPNGHWVAGTFLPNGEASTIIELTADEQISKRGMLASFHSQMEVLRPFGTERESFRPAPAYDFRTPPHAGTLNYERYDWGMDGPRWRELAGQALLTLGFPP